MVEIWSHRENHALFNILDMARYLTIRQQNIMLEALIIFDDQCTMPAKDAVY